MRCQLRSTAFLLSILTFQPVSYPQFQSGPPWVHPVAHTQTIYLEKRAIQVDFGPGKLDLPQEQVVDWVRRAAVSVSTYYGRLPVELHRVLIEPVAGESGILRGTTWGGVGGAQAFTLIRLGEHTDSQTLNDDWEMPHELIHAAFPSLDDDHAWMEEGLATYIEPIARVQAGFLQPERIWADMTRDMPKGNPAAYDRGLDQTHTWGRTYWGGAQFCLAADVAIREQTHNRLGLQDALRAIVQAGGTIEHDWALGKALAIGDKATGTHVLEDLYSAMGTKPKQVDLENLWQRLGVVRTAQGVRLDDTAPEAPIRRAITAKKGLSK